MATRKRRKSKGEAVFLPLRPIDRGCSGAFPLGGDEGDAIEADACS